MKIPVIDSQVRVTLSDPMGPAMIPPRAGTQVLEGRVVKAYKWLTDREFCITGDAAFPVRVINSAQVEDLEIISGSAQNIDTDIKTWTVQGSKGNEYTVSRWPGGWSCTCPGFQFRKSCKHTTNS
jgi:hypothetical protein